MKLAKVHSVNNSINNIMVHVLHPKHFKNALHRLLF